MYAEKMNSVRILHAADFHLDSPFRGLPPEQARQRRREGRAALVRLAELANERAVELVLLAGDLFDSGEIYRETAQALAVALGRMHAQVFLAPGNHDCWDGRGPYAAVDWPENVHIFKSKTIEAVELPEQNCVIYGAAFTEPECGDSLLRGFHVPADDGRLHIMVLHADVDGSGRYNAVSRDDIAESGLDYLALGHVHRFGGVEQAGGTAWAYSGCPEGRGFDECGERGVLVGDVSREKAALEFVPFARRRYEVLRLDITGRNPLDALEEAADRLRPEEDVYRVLFTGETDAGGVDLAEIHERMAGRFYHLELRDETTAAGDLWKCAGGDSLRGLFLGNLLARRAAAATEEERARIDRAAKWGIAAMEGREL